MQTIKSKSLLYGGPELTFSTFIFYEFIFYDNIFTTLFFMSFIFKKSSKNPQVYNVLTLKTNENQRV